MEVTEATVTPAAGSPGRLLAYCNLVLDGEFVVHDLKVIRGNEGIFVAMPSRKMAARCAICRTNNHLAARYCNQCGGPLPLMPPDAPKLHVDVAHPITPDCRARIEAAVLVAHAESTGPPPDDGPPLRGHLARSAENRELAC